MNDQELTEYLNRKQSINLEDYLMKKRFSQTDEQMAISVNKQFSEVSDEDHNRVRMHLYLEAKDKRQYSDAEVDAIINRDYSNSSTQAVKSVSDSLNVTPKKGVSGRLMKKQGVGFGDFLRLSMGGTTRAVHTSVGGLVRGGGKALEYTPQRLFNTVAAKIFGVEEQFAKMHKSQDDFVQEWGREIIEQGKSGEEWWTKNISDEKKQSMLGQFATGTGQLPMLVFYAVPPVGIASTVGQYLGEGYEEAESAGKSEGDQHLIAFGYAALWAPLGVAIDKFTAGVGGKALRGIKPGSIGKSVVKQSGLVVLDSQVSGVGELLSETAESATLQKMTTGSVDWKRARREGMLAYLIGVTGASVAGGVRVTDAAQTARKLMDTGLDEKTATRIADTLVNQPENMMETIDEALVEIEKTVGERQSGFLPKGERKIPDPESDQYDIYEDDLEIGDEESALIESNVEFVDAVTKPLTKTDARHWGETLDNNLIDLIFEDGEMRELFKNAINGDEKARIEFNQRIVGNEDVAVEPEDLNGQPPKQEDTPSPSAEEGAQPDVDPEPLFDEGDYYMPSILSVADEIGILDQVKSGIVPLKKLNEKVLSGELEEVALRGLGKFKAGVVLDSDEKVAIGLYSNHIMQEVRKVRQSNKSDGEKAVLMEALENKHIDVMEAHAKTIAEAGRTLRNQQIMNAISVYTDIDAAMRKWSQLHEGKVPDEQTIADLEQAVKDSKKSQEEMDSVKESILNDERESIKEEVESYLSEDDDIEGDLDEVKEKAQEHIYEGFLSYQQAQDIQTLFRLYVKMGLVSDLDTGMSFLKDDFPEIPEMELMRAVGGRIKGQTRLAPEWAKLLSELKTEANLRSKIDDAYNGVFESVKQGKDPKPEIEQLRHVLKIITSSNTYEQMSAKRKERLLRRIENADNHIKNLSRDYKYLTGTPDDVEISLKNILKERLEVLSLQDQYAELFDQIFTGQFKSKLRGTKTASEAVAMWQEKVNELKIERQRRIDEGTKKEREASAEAKKKEKSLDELNSVLDQYQRSFREIRTSQEKLSNSIKSIKELTSRVRRIMGLEDIVADLEEQLRTNHLYSKWSFTDTPTDGEISLKLKIKELREARQKIIKEGTKEERAEREEQLDYDRAIERLNSLLDNYQKIHRTVRKVSNRKSDRVESVKRLSAEILTLIGKEDVLFDLEAQLETGAFYSKWSPEKKKSDAEKAIDSKIELAKAARKKIIDEATKEQREIDAEEAAYIKAVEQLEEVIKMHEQNYRPIKTIKKEQSDRIKKIKNEIRSIKHLVAIDDKIADIEHQIKTGQFKSDWKPKSEITAAEHDAMVRLGNARKHLNHIIYKGLPKTVGGNVVDAMNMLRVLKLTADNSALGVQLIRLIASHPDAWSASFVNSFKAMTNEDFSIAANEAIRLHPLYQLATEAGFVMQDADDAALLQRDEVHLTEMENKIPGLSKWIIKPSNRAMAAAVNTARFNLFVQQMETGVYKTSESRQKLMSYINVSTGRGRLKFGEAGSLEGSQKFLGIFVTSARMISSAIEDPVIIATHWDRNTDQPFAKTTQGLILKDKAKELAALVSLFVMWGMMFGKDKVDLDPESTTFLRLRIGSSWINPLGRYMAVNRMLIRSAHALGEEMGWIGDGKNNWSLKTEAQRFFEYRTTPWVSLAYGLIDGEDWRGAETSRIGLVARAPLSITAEEMFDMTTKSQNDPALSTAILLGKFMGFSEFEKEQEKSKKGKKVEAKKL